MSKSDTMVMTFGRMNPPTVGHEKLVNKVLDTAKAHKADHSVILSHSQDSKKNPLSAEQKVKHAQRFFPKAHIQAASKDTPTLMHHAAEFHKQGYKHLVMVAGEDRASEYEKKLNQYNGKFNDKGQGYHFKSIKVVSAGHRDPNASGVEGMSASKMRAHAQKGEFEHFKKGIPSHVSHEHAQDLYNDVRKGMKIQEEMERDLYIKGEVFNKGDIVEDLVTGQTCPVEFRGDNYVTIILEDGSIVKRFITNVTVEDAKHDFLKGIADLVKQSKKRNKMKKKSLKEIMSEQAPMRNKNNMEPLVRNADGTMTPGQAKHAAAKTATKKPIKYTGPGNAPPYGSSFWKKPLVRNEETLKEAPKVKKVITDYRTWLKHHESQGHKVTANSSSDNAVISAKDPKSGKLMGKWRHYPNGVHGDYVSPHQAGVVYEEGPVVDAIKKTFHKFNEKLEQDREEIRKAANNENPDYFENFAGKTIEEAVDLLEYFTLTKNMVRMALFRAGVNTFQASNFARSLTPEHLTNRQAFASHLKDHGFSLEQSLALVRHLSPMHREEFDMTDEQIEAMDNLNEGLVRSAHKLLQKSDMYKTQPEIKAKYAKAATMILTSRHKELVKYAAGEGRGIRTHIMTALDQGGDEGKQWARKLGMWTETIEGEMEHQDHTKNVYHKVLTKHGFAHHATNHKVNPYAPKDGSGRGDYTEHVYHHPDHGKSHVITTHYHIPGRDGQHSWIFRHEQRNGIMAPTHGNTKPQLDRSLAREYGLPMPEGTMKTFKNFEQPEVETQDDLQEKAPPGMEKMVKKLKTKYPGHHEYAFATAWKIYNRKHGIRAEELEAAFEEACKIIEDEGFTITDDQGIVYKVEGDTLDEKYLGFDKLKAKLSGHVSNPGAVAASIGRKKYGKKKFQSAAAHDHSLRNEDALEEAGSLSHKITTSLRKVNPNMRQHFADRATGEFITSKSAKFVGDKRAKQAGRNAVRYDRMAAAGAKKAFTKEEVVVAEDRNMDRWAKEKAAENRARLDIDRSGRSNAPKREKAFQSLLRSMTSKTPKVDHAKLAQDMENAWGNSFPDGDPYDHLMHQYSDLHRNYTLSKHMDIAARKHLGAKSWGHYQARSWDEYHKDNHDNPDSMTKGQTNPWK